MPSVPSLLQALHLEATIASMNRAKEVTSLRCHLKRKLEERIQAEHMSLIISKELLELNDKMQALEAEFDLVKKRKVQWVTIARDRQVEEKLIRKKMDQLFQDRDIFYQRQSQAFKAPKILLEDYCFVDGNGTMEMLSEDSMSPQEQRQEAGQIDQPQDEDQSER